MRTLFPHWLPECSSRYGYVFANFPSLPWGGSGTSSTYGSSLLLAPRFIFLFPFPLNHRCGEEWRITPRTFAGWRAFLQALSRPSHLHASPSHGGGGAPFATSFASAPWIHFNQKHFTSTTLFPKGHTSHLDQDIPGGLVPPASPGTFFRAWCGENFGFILTTFNFSWNLVLR